MNGRFMFGLLGPLVTLTSASNATPVADKAKELARIESECALKKGTLTVHGESVWFRPSPDEDYEHVDCALTRLRTAGLGKVGFIGNEFDPNAVLPAPLRYIAEGSTAQVAALVKAATADKWIITRTASASDGIAIVQLESAPTMTSGQASKLLNRVWKQEFGDIAFGTAPRKLSARDPNDD